jgi:hypothetical protein
MSSARATFLDKRCLPHYSTQTSSRRTRKGAHFFRRARGVRISWLQGVSR